MLRPVRSSADDLCAEIRTGAAGVEREILAANMTAEHVAAFEKGAQLGSITEACASQVKLLAACDDLLALLAAQFGHWSFDADARVLNWDATIPDEVVDAYEQATAQIDREATTLERPPCLPRVGDAAPRQQLPEPAAASLRGNRTERSKPASPYSSVPAQPTRAASAATM